MSITSGTPTGQIAMSDCNAEFGRGYELDNYYGCAYAVPTSGQIAMSDLRGKYRYWGGRRFIAYNPVQALTGNRDNTEYNTTGYGWRFSDIQGWSNNPGVASGTTSYIRNVGTYGDTVVEKAFFYYYWGYPAAGWRFVMQTWRGSGQIYNQARYAIADPYRQYLRVSLNSGQYQANLAFFFSPTGNPRGWYRYRTGDTSRRQIMTWLWPTSFTLSGYMDVQWATSSG